MTNQAYDPPRHALATLEACGGDLELALGQARYAALHADGDDIYWFWVGVRDALNPKRVAQC